MKFTALLIGTTVLAGAVAAPACAKEVTSGGTTTAVCNPVDRLDYKGDATTGDTAQATVQFGYVVKPCTKDAVRVAVTMFQSSVPSNVLFSDPAAAMSGRFTVGVIARTSYQVRVDVYNAATGALQGTKTIYAAAVPKGV